MEEIINQDPLLYSATRWTMLAANYNPDQELVESLWLELVQAYSGHGRYYHNIGHIAYLLQKEQTYNGQVNDGAALQFAVFYHDIVYCAGRSDNEERSAGKAVAVMEQLLVPPATIQKSRTMILATKAHNTSPDPDTNLLTDMDLAILGEPWPQYQAYTQQICKEYAVYPDFMYRRGRRKVLEHFLAMGRIYKTAYFLERYEAQARKNMRQELLQL